MLNSKYSRLKHQSKNCDLHDTEREINKELIRYGRTLEATTVHGQAMVGPSVSNEDDKLHKMYSKPQTRQKDRHDYPSDYG